RPHPAKRVTPLDRLGSVRPHLLCRGNFFSAGLFGEPLLGASAHRRARRLESRPRVRPACLRAPRRTVAPAGRAIGLRDDAGGRALGLPAWTRGREGEGLVLTGGAGFVSRVARGGRQVLRVSDHPSAGAGSGGVRTSW